RGLTGAQHRDDVRVLQRGGQHDLALESVDRNRGRELEWQHLDDDGSPQRVVSRHEHARHTSAAELSLEGVGGTQRSLQFFSKYGHIRVRRARGIPSYGPFNT